MNVYDFINWFFMYSFLGYLLECIVPVSYTHLDVYKRQALTRLKGRRLNRVFKNWATTHPVTALIRS